MPILKSLRDPLEQKTFHDFLQWEKEGSRLLLHNSPELQEWMNAIVATKMEEIHQTYRNIAQALIMEATIIDLR